MPTRIVGYCRVSTEGQADAGSSLDAQRAKLRAYVIAMDLELVEVVVDAGQSAKTMDRPGLARVLAMLDSGEADGVLVAKLDRLTRSVRDLGELVERYFADRAKTPRTLLSVGDSIDTRSAAGRLVLNVLASVSQWEREACGERTRETLAHLRSQGVLVGGVPLGMRRTGTVDDDGRHVVEPDEAETATVRRIRELRHEGRSLRSIVETLQTEGHATKRGGLWAPTTVKRVLDRTAPQGGTFVEPRREQEEVAHAAE